MWPFYYLLPTVIFFLSHYKKSLSPPPGRQLLPPRPRALNSSCFWGRPTRGKFLASHATAKASLREALPHHQGVPASTSPIPLSSSSPFCPAHSSPLCSAPSPLPVPDQGSQTRSPASPFLASNAASSFSSPCLAQSLLASSSSDFLSP